MGASRGIGAAVARCLAREGCDLVVCARSEPPLQRVAHELRADTGRNVIPISCDTRDSGSIEQLGESLQREFGQVEILVNCAARAAGTVPEDWLTIDDDQVLADMKEKFLGYFRLARLVLPGMQKAGWGQIVNVAGASADAPGTAISSPARNAAVVAMTRALASAVAASGVHVNAVHPGPTLTEDRMLAAEEEAKTRGTSLEDLLTHRAKRSQLGYLTDANDVARVITFLVSPSTRGINGRVLYVSSWLG